jgi:bacillolysin
MADTFQSIHFNVAAETDDNVKGVGARPLVARTGPSRVRASNSFESDEAAARFYLDGVLARDHRSNVRGLRSPEAPQIVPDLQLRDSQRSPLTKTSIVRFVQTKSSIPVFGSRAIVEIDNKRELLAVDAELADVEGVSPIANVAPQKALQSIAAAAEVSVESLIGVKAPTLTFYRDEDEKRYWHLAYHYENVPAAPAEFFVELKSHGHMSLANSHPELDYLVDAHDGSILIYWSSSPTLVRCKGVDEESVVRKFYGDRVGEGMYVLRDKMQHITTIDLGGRSIDVKVLPSDPLSMNSTTFVNCEAAISAHYNASLVCDFLRTVLKRDGIDGKGMELVSYVNCTSPSDEPPPEWHNAAWWRQRMWYGQAKDSDGKLRSYARHLDIIAHELAHGLTEFTANLAYLQQSGALNESFSDIFGTIIRNWDRSQPDTGGNPANWKWEIGAGLGEKGCPLRDMSAPSRTGDPDHMKDYLKTRSDNGGVHTNSNIHNKAAYNFLTAKDGEDNFIFAPLDVAVLYYQVLIRLDKIASFKQTRDTLINVATIYFSGDPQNREKVDAISAAYAAAGII